MTDRFQFQPTDALMVVYVQNDFCPGGALAVEGGDEVVPVLNHAIAAATRGATMMVVMDFQGARIRDDSGSKPTRGCTRNSLIPLHFPLRAFLCGEGFEHREQWIEDRLQTLSGCFAASVCGFAVIDNHLHVLMRLKPDAANGWSAEDVRPAVVGDQRIKESTDRGS